MAWRTKEKGPGALTPPCAARWGGNSSGEFPSGQDVLFPSQRNFRSGDLKSCP
jgi:hypothetical protein